MSRHEGVSCDSCLKGNFRGRRYKCLICYDYDLCATCYESGATTTRHTTEHPMQCILTRSDFDLYYGGEALSVEQPQAFTCPFCYKMGFTETSLHDHVSAEHSDSSFEVVCPICAALPVGEPNHVTDDFLGHLTLEHRGSRELEDSGGGGSSNSRPVRRIPHPGRGGMNHGARRRHAAHMQFASSSAGFSSLSPSNRESMDPIAELLSQLSGVRRSATTTSASHTQTTSAQLQQLQMQLQLERQHAQMARQQLERLPAARRQQHLQTAAAAAATNSLQPIFAPNSTAVLGRTLLPMSQQQFDLRPNLTNVHSNQFLLSRCTESNLSENEQNAFEIEQADHSLFVQELLLMSLSDEGTTIGSSSDADGAISSLLAIEDYDKSCDQPDSSVDRHSSTSKKCEGGAASKTVSSSNNELLSNSSLVLSRKHANSSQSSKVVSMKQPQQQQQPPQQQQQQPPVVVRDSPIQSPMSRMGLPARISGSGTQNIGGGAGYNMRNQPGNGGSGAGPGIVRGGTPAGSTSSGRTRKVQRHIDDRNKSNEPPPPH